MSVALFFITHEGIASNLLRISETIVRKPNGNLSHFEILLDAPIDKTIDAIEYKLKQLTIDDGIIFFTDIYGSTPGNIAQRLATKYKADLISGVNLPMIIRMLNYRDEPEPKLLQRALEGAHHGIQCYVKETTV